MINTAKFIAAAAITLSMLASAFAGPFDNIQYRTDLSGVTDRIVISEDLGGSLLEYIHKYTEWRHGDAKVEVDGLCISACTFMTGMLKPENVCVTDTALFGFHSASTGSGEFAYEATRLIWNMYPAQVRDYLVKHGWDGAVDKEHPQLVWVPGTVFYDKCQ